MAQIIPLLDYKEEEIIVPDTELLSWVMERVDSWREHRDSIHKEKWDEYYRIWRGIWSENDASRASERSKLISPASQQAVESAVSELEEATFGRGTWFDIEDDIADQQKVDIQALRTLMKEELEREGAKSGICEVFLYSALYGIGIGEILIDEKTEIVPQDKPVNGTPVAFRGTQEQKYNCIRLNPVSPYNFVVDVAAKTIEDALGCAVEDVVARHTVVKLQKEGIYRDQSLGAYTEYSKVLQDDEIASETGDLVKITRYYGLAPKSLIEDFNSNVVYADLGVDGELDEELVEAVIVIANDSVILKAIQTPYMMKDRPVMAFPYDKIPGKFYGRGVIEKGYNAQKALDSELRARMDSMALTIHPMLAADATRLPRGAKLEVSPGKTILTNGNPQNILMPFHFGNTDPTSFRQSADFERMVTMATGAMDTAAPIGVNPRNNTMGGMSMMQGAAIKRQKRTLMNFQENFLVPFIKKAAYRFMQFMPDRYPIMDYKFIPTSTMGLMAREYETQQMVQLMNTVPKESPVYMLLLRNVYENSSLQNRDDVIAALDQMMQPNPEQQQIQQAGMQLEFAQKQKEIEYKDALIMQIQEKSQLEKAEFMLEAQIANMPKEQPPDRSRDIEIDNRAKIADLALREKEIDLKEREMDMSELDKRHRMTMDYHDRELIPKTGDETNPIVEMMGNIFSTVAAIPIKLHDLEKKIDTPKAMNIKRDANGKIIEVNGRKVKYNKDGLMEGME